MKRSYLYGIWHRQGDIDIRLTPIFHRHDVSHKRPRYFLSRMGFVPSQ
nr:MAG TPA: hypothetical protein [Caudoviricetes sp.]